MKTLLTLYTGDDWKLDQPVMSNGLDRSYQAWGRVAQRQKVQITRASMTWYRRGAFTKYWRYDQRADRWEKIKKTIKPDGIYDKARVHDRKTGQQLVYLLGLKREIGSAIPMVNIPQFSELVDNKLTQAVIFADAMPSTQLWLPGASVKNPSGKTVVLKTIGGSGGTFVKITKNKSIPVKQLSIQQNFIMATKGGVLRDIRICYIGDQPQYVYSRVAAPGSLYTNVHMGAHMEFMKLKEIPELLVLCKRLMGPLRIFPKRIMSFDFLIDAKKGHPYLVETNTMPGTNNFSDALLERFFDRVTRYTLD
ncbi:MAG: hypothetical protein Q8P33_00920 [bacterium]|nr:hypothetical protein [bacterium]